MEQVFANREEAGMLLAKKLEAYKGNKDVIVLGIPRGGVPVAFQIAQQLHLPLEIILSKKIGHPGNPEYAIGAVTESLVYVDKSEGVSEEYINEEVKRIRKQIAERNKLFRGDKAPVNFKNKVVIVADDGIATGKTLLITIEMLRKAGVSKIIVASPVVPQSRVSYIENACDEFIYLYAPAYFDGVGAFYQEFQQVSDEEVKELLNRK